MSFHFTSFDLLSYCIQTYLVIGLLWACIASYWLDRIPNLFLSTGQSIKFLVLVVMSWPYIVYLSLRRGIKRTLLVEILVVIYHLHYQRLFNIYGECYQKLTANKISQQLPKPHILRNSIASDKLEDVLYIFYLITATTQLSQHQQAQSFRSLWKLVSLQNKFEV